MNFNLCGDDIGSVSDFSVLVAPSCRVVALAEMEVPQLRNEGGSVFQFSERAVFEASCLPRRRLTKAGRAVLLAMP